MITVKTVSLLILCVTSLQSSPASEPESAPRILFFGNSLCAGYGLAPEQAFPALIQQKIDSLGLKFTVVNAGLSGETSSGGLRRIDWLLRQRVNIFVLELGGNDALRGIDLDVTEANLQGIIDKVLKRYPEALVVLAGMQAPPNLGREYVTRFKAIYPKLARQNKCLLIPFLLEDVGGIAELNQADGIHPTAEGHRIISETVWGILQTALKQLK